MPRGMPICASVIQGVITAKAILRRNWNSWDGNGGKKRWWWLRKKVIKMERSCRGNLVFLFVLPLNWLVHSPPLREMKENKCFSSLGFSSPQLCSSALVSCLWRAASTVWLHSIVERCRHCLLLPGKKHQIPKWTENNGSTDTCQKSFKFLKGRWVADWVRDMTRSRSAGLEVSFCGVDNVEVCLTPKTVNASY